MRAIYKILSSAYLAISLLIVIFIISIISVTAMSYDEAMRKIFTRAWFNAILILLVVNIIFCFFPKIGNRKMTLTFFGMCLFHTSFVFVLLGIIYNSLFYFRANVRITEGETLSLQDISTYDNPEMGHLFDLKKLRGEITLHHMHVDYKVKGKNKRVAYEVEIGEGFLKKRDLIYITNPFRYKGFNFYNDSEGYSLLIILYDEKGKELYGAHLPLQSLRQKDGTYLYTTGTRFEPGWIPFPQSPLSPLFGLQVIYNPSIERQRHGDVMFTLLPFKGQGVEFDKPIGRGGARIAEIFDSGKYRLEAREVRYWVKIHVRYDPGKPIILTFFWIGLAGLVITTVGRLRGQMMYNKGGGENEN